VPRPVETHANQEHYEAIVGLRRKATREYARHLVPPSAVYFDYDQPLIMTGGAKPSAVP
jgi:hypothetical protein